MIYNHASRLIVNLLFKEIDRVLVKINSLSPIAYSSLMDCLPQPVSAEYSIIIRSLLKEYIIYISVRDFSPDEYSLIDRSIIDNSNNIRNILQIVFRKDFSVLCQECRKNNINVSKSKLIILSVIHNNAEGYVEFYIPPEFFRLFSRRIMSETPVEIIESEIINFFSTPGWMVPDFKYVYTTLGIPELINLTNLLQRKNLLTPYHIFLLLRSFPELSGIMKKLLSKNIINDVIRYNKTADGLKVNRRDIAGAIYSIEESIYFILHEGFDVYYSELLRSMQQLIRWSQNMDLLSKKTFMDWIKDMIADDLLYATVSITDDQTAACALSRDRNACIKLFENHLSQKKLNAILQITDMDFTYEEILRSQITFILNYRKVKINKIHASPDSLEYLIALFSISGQYHYLLLSAGWFNISTAMKGFNKKNIDRVLMNLPAPPRILIEDVLKGIVNPNILHDEIQINKAKKVCVDSILQLYIDGIINLDL